MSIEPLLDRRRHRTERDIALAALGLFEERGVDGTTVDDIARVAGVSARTVFRYATTKERAALIADHEVETQVDRALDDLQADRPLVPQLVELWRDVLAAFDDGRSGPGSQALRLWRLAAREPRLMLAAIAQDEERLTRVQSQLVDRLDLDPLAVRVSLESTAAVVRVVLDRWACDPGTHGLVSTYDAACRALRDQLGPP
ncbi:hypothetical protein ASG49_00500 [Marmoricola sp. Leaf446]|uniref:TetR/AcrR family transcriptional regulator n=1 Tax=Marmoricola sp. Leaf446 TaxID=1736379 RepID=UPI000701EF0C|nr:TetR/AcrR family transcriptional regulator [Marmoricola sp. Leaf446]KQT93532.1 hypothetical protein ASG49_00500 [Marmoricola sp. Leaf446]